jgi:PIN domain nuclease of toxin-antitoxin system
VGLNLLLDSHTLLWWWCCPRLLSPRVHGLLSDPEQPVWVSAASLLEISQAQKRGQLPELAPVIWELPELVRQEGFQLLAITARHGLMAGQWRPLRGSGALDHTARLLLAQAQLENLTLVSADPTLRSAAGRCLW